jgi:hypothetical protein
MEIQFFRSALSARNRGYPLPDNAALTCFGRGGGGEWQGSFSPSHKVRFGTSYLQDCAIPFLGTVIITRHGGALDFAT